MQIQTKSIFHSSTFYFGLLQIALALVGLFTGHMGSTEALTLISTGFSTIGLRIKTDTPVSLSGGIKYRE